MVRQTFDKITLQLVFDTPSYKEGYKKIEIYFISTKLRESSICFQTNPRALIKAKSKEVSWTKVADGTKVPVGDISDSAL